MFNETTVGYFNKFPINLYRCKRGNTRVFFSGGIHHYENTRKHLHRLVAGNGVEGIDLMVVPEMNPGNFLGLNRCFNMLDIPNEYAFLRGLPPLDLAVDFHADFEATKFYVYERHLFGYKDFCNKWFQKLYIPCRGYEKIEPELESTLEEFMHGIGAKYSITTETPQGFFRTHSGEVDFNFYLAETILDTIKSL